MKPRPGNRKEAEWAEAKRQCRLTDEDVRKARELNLSARSLIKNRPSKSQAWKAPVHLWVRGLYERMLERSAQRRARQADPSSLDERAAAIARKPREVYDAPSAHHALASPLGDRDRIEASDHFPASMPEPEWDPVLDDVGDDCPF